MKKAQQQVQLTSPGGTLPAAVQAEQRAIYARASERFDMFLREELARPTPPQTLDELTRSIAGPVF